MKEEELLSQHQASVQKKPTGRTRLLKAQIRRDKQRIKLEADQFKLCVKPPGCEAISQRSSKH